MLAVVALAAVLAALGNATQEPAASPSARCKVVIKKVHGKKRRVRVCPKPKPKPGLPSAGTVVAAISLPRGAAPAGLLALPSAVWVAGHRSDSIFRIDPASNSVVAQVKVTHEAVDQPSFMVYGDGVLFAVNYGDESVALVDPVQNVVERFATSPGENGYWPVFADGSVWLVTRAGVVRMDASGRVIATVVPGPGHPGLAFGAGSIWGFSETDGEVFRIDPATNQVTARIATKAVPTAFGAGSVWASTASR